METVKIIFMVGLYHFHLHVSAFSRIDFWVTVNVYTKC